MLMVLGKLLALFTGASSFVQTLLVGGSLLLGSNALTALVVGIKAHNAGRAGVIAEYNTAAEREKTKHREWLERVAGISGGLSDADDKAEKANDELQRTIEDQMGKLSDGAKPFPPKFLRDLDGIR